jgi:hypothetical protein
MNNPSVIVAPKTSTISSASGKSLTPEGKDAFQRIPEAKFVVAERPIRQTIACGKKSLTRI